MPFANPDGTLCNIYHLNHLMAEVIETHKAIIEKCGQAILYCRCDSCVDFRKSTK